MQPNNPPYIGFDNHHGCQNMQVMNEQSAQQNSSTFFCQNSQASNEHAP
jgi:hypothetical protein